MKNLTQNKRIFHMIVERDTQKIVYGTLGYTVFVDMNGEPQIKTLKVNKARRLKYGK